MGYNGLNALGMPMGWTDGTGSSACHARARIAIAEAVHWINDYVNASLAANPLSGRPSVMASASEHTNMRSPRQSFRLLNQHHACAARSADNPNRLWKVHTHLTQCGRVGTRRDRSPQRTFARALVYGYWMPVDADGELVGERSICHPRRI